MVWFLGRPSPVSDCHAVNDVKKFVLNGTPWYLMGLHFNDDSLRYSLSNDGVSFSSEQDLFGNLSAQDLYIVAVGFVTKSDRLLGVLYGAGAVASLDQNQIFARWLQKKDGITPLGKGTVTMSTRQAYQLVVGGG